MVTLINHFGHEISYTELEELQTAMAESRLSQNNADDVYLPSNINPALRDSLCLDNNDINEETLSGSGTTHCTNGIAIQRQQILILALLLQLYHVKNIDLKQEQ